MEDVRSAWKGTIARVKIAQCNNVLDEREFVVRSQVTVGETIHS